MSFDHTLHTLERGVKWPFFEYRGTKLIDWWSAINGLMADVSDRRGLKEALVNVEPANKTQLEHELGYAVRGDATGEPEKVLALFQRWLPTFSQEWDTIDEDIQAEILGVWQAIIVLAFTDGCKGANLDDVARRRFKREVEAALEPPEDTPGYDLEAYQWMLKGVEKVLGVIQGEGQNQGYHLVPKDIGLNQGPDISDNVLTYFQDINS